MLVECGVVGPSWYRVTREGMGLPVRCRRPMGHDGFHVYYLAWYHDEPLPIEIDDVDLVGDPVDTETVVGS